MRRTFSFPASRHFATAWRISLGARNCPFFTETLLPVPRAGEDEVGLAAEEGGDLEDVHHPPRGLRLPGLVHVGACRGARSRASPPRRRRAPPRAPGRGSSCREERFALSKLALKTTGSPCFSASAFTLRACARAWASSSMTHGPGDEQEPPAVADLVPGDAGEDLGSHPRRSSRPGASSPRPAGCRCAWSRCSRAARTNPAKSGCGANGFDLNSGWNWQPTKCGWLFSSIISTRSRSGFTPGEDHPRRLVLGAVGVVELEAVAVALVHEVGAVELARLGAAP